MANHWHEMCDSYVDTPRVPGRMGTMRRWLLLAVRRHGFLALWCASTACQSHGGSDPSGAASGKDNPAFGESPSAAQVFGGQTSDGTGVISGDAQSAGDECDVQSTSIPLEPAEAAEELGFSALEVATWVAVGVDERASWAPDGQLETAPESGDGRLSIAFQVMSDSARLHFPDISASGEPPPPVCGPWIEVDATATLTTPGGALDERFPVKLRAARPFVFSFVGSLLQSELEGGLQLTSPAAGELRDDLDVSGTVTPYGSYGAVTVRAVDDAFPRSTVLRWPAAGDCSLDGTLRFAGSDTLYGLDVDSLLQAYTGLDPVPLSWTDGERANVELLAEPEAPLCVSTRWWGEGSFASFSTLLSAKSDDERWDATYPALVRVHVDTKRGPMAFLKVALELLGEQQGELGLSQLTAEPTESVRLRLELERTLPDGAPGGQLNVTGDSDTHCHELPVEEVDSCLAENQGLELVGAELGE